MTECLILSRNISPVRTLDFNAKRMGQLFVKNLNEMLK